jgi:hypothetical protein
MGFDEENRAMFQSLALLVATVWKYIPGLI